MDARDFILKVGQTLRMEDYAFTVEAGGHSWDVYRFRAKGKDGMLAFRPVDEPSVKFEISFFRAGDFTAEEVARQISAWLPS